MKNKYYLIGIKGAGVSALALLLDELGYEVSGYDDAREHRFTEDKLVARGIKIYSDPNDEMDENTIVVRSTAIFLDHPELLKAQKLGLPIYEYHEMLGILTKKLTSTCVSGCHGKTTTTAMISHILMENGGCNYIIGDGRGHGDEKNDRFVLESCEYKRHFLAYTPMYGIITNIEMDHTDYFTSMDDMVLAYKEFSDNVSKLVIVCGDDPYTRKIEYTKPHMFFGLEDGNDIQAINVEYSNDGTIFDLVIEGKNIGHFDLPLFGKHMLYDALAAISVCYFEGISAEEIAKSLATFKGAERRFKEKFIKNNVVIDDYAHHPTEVAVTIKAARQKYPDKTIVAIFKAHTFSRVERFKQEFADALNLADYAYVMDINYDRERKEDFPNISAYTIIDLLNNGDYIEQGMAEKLLKYDNAAILFMSSKEIYLLEKQYEDLLMEK